MDSASFADENGTFSAIELLNGGVNLTHSQGAAGQLENGGNRIKKDALPPP